MMVAQMSVAAGVDGAMSGILAQTSFDRLLEGVVDPRNLPLTADAAGGTAPIEQIPVTYRGLDLRARVRALAIENHPFFGAEIGSRHQFVETVFPSAWLQRIAACCRFCRQHSLIPARKLRVQTAEEAEFSILPAFLRRPRSGAGAGAHGTIGGGAGADQSVMTWERYRPSQDIVVAMTANGSILLLAPAGAGEGILGSYKRVDYRRGERNAATDFYDRPCRKPGNIVIALGERAFVEDTEQTGQARTWINATQTLGAFIARTQIDHRDLFAQIVGESQKASDDTFARFRSDLEFSAF